MNQLIKIVFLIACVLFTLLSYSQKVEYTYDPAGNRVMRMLVTVGGGGNKGNNDSTETQNEEINHKFGGYEMNVYPNPTQGKLRLTLDEAFMESFQRRVEVYSTEGKLIYSKDPVNQNSFEIDLTREVPGNYFLKVIGDEASSQWKIVKM